MKQKYYNSRKRTGHFLKNKYYKYILKGNDKKVSWGPTQPYEIGL